MENVNFLLSLNVNYPILTLILDFLIVLKRQEIVEICLLQGRLERSESDPECIYLTSTTCRKGGVEFTPGIDYCKDQVTGECMNMFENNHIARESPSYIMCMDLGINACRGPLGDIQL